MTEHPASVARATRLVTQIDGRVLAVLVAAGAAFAFAVLRVGLNSPVGVPATVEHAYDELAFAAHVVPGIVAVAFGVTATDPRRVVGYLAIGVFALLAAVAPAAELGALGGIIAGGALVALHRSRHKPTVVSVAVLAGVAVTLASATGLLPVATRATGSALALVGIASTALLVDPDRYAIGAGVAVGALVLAVGAAAPFVTGAVVLVGWAAVGVPLVLLAVALGGSTTVVATGVTRSDGLLVAAGVLLIAGGVPATVPRALAVVLGFVLVVEHGGSA